jgi:hypothetical protein
MLHIFDEADNDCLSLGLIWEMFINFKYTVYNNYEDRDSMFFKNASNHLPHYSVIFQNIPSYLSHRELQNLLITVNPWSHVFVGTT